MTENIIRAIDPGECEKPKTIHRTVIYSLADPRNGEVRYIGKTVTTESNRLRGHMKDKENTPKTGWIKSLKKLGLKPVIEAVEETTELDWKECEKFWIENFRQMGCRLTNVCKGAILRRS